MEPSGQLNLILCKRFFSKLLGLLMFTRLEPNTAMLLMHCRSVHTHGMRFAIDIVFLDMIGRVIKVEPSVGPWRVKINWSAFHVVELAAGEAARLGITVGSHLNLLKKTEVLQFRNPASTNQLDTAAASSDVFQINSACGNAP
jgi:uncharacterized protein